MKPIIDNPVEYWIDKFISNKPYSLSRFGDGETLSMFNSPKLRENCDGSKFLPEIAEPMKDIFRKNFDYYHCFLDCTFEPAFKPQVDKFKAFFDDTCPDMQIYNGEIWHYMSDAGNIRELVDAIAHYEPCFVGGKHLKNVEHIYGFNKINFIETPQYDSFKEIDRIIDDIMALHATGSRFFAFSTGYTTKILIDRLYPVIGSDTFLIDFGSVWDAYCGILSRDGMQFRGLKYYQPFTKLKLI